MSDKSKIEWTDATWNPIRGCSRVSRGCGGPGKQGGCYAERVAARFSGPGQPYEGLAELVTRPDGSREARWTGVVRETTGDTLTQPLRWKRARRIFVNSMSDLFHENLSENAIDRVFAVMALCPQHTFQVLTKRPERMRHYWDRMNSIADAAGRLMEDGDNAHDYVLNLTWPLPNMWLGVSCEDQETADVRIPLLLKTPAAVRFISAEPLLGPIELWRFDEDDQALRGCGVVESGGVSVGTPHDPPEGYDDSYPGLDWVIVGGESGPSARPMHPDWAQSLAEQCKRAAVPFFFKQWGEWASQGPHNRNAVIDMDRGCIVPQANQVLLGSGLRDGRTLLTRVGKKAAGRLLGGFEHNGFPGAR